MRHLGTGDLIDVAEGRARRAASAHASACPRCRDAVERLRATMAEARAVEVPEPSPLFWDHFSTRVRQAVAAEPGPTAAGRWLPGSWRFGSLGFAGAVIVLALAVWVGVHGLRTTGLFAPRATVASAPAARAASAAGQGSATAQDASLDLVADLSSGMNWNQAVDAGITVSPGATDLAVSQLSTPERAALVRLLKAELDHSSS